MLLFVDFSGVSTSDQKLHFRFGLHLSLSLQCWRNKANLPSAALSDTFNYQVPKAPISTMIEDTNTISGLDYGGGKDAVASVRSIHTHGNTGTKSPVDHQRIERAVREILAAIGEDPDREGLLETPARVARMYAEVFSGLHKDPRIHLKRVFSESYDEIVLLKDIEFQSMCEHHLLPFHGRAHVGYLPDGKVVGLSKMARVVDEVARRPQVQERMTESIANMMEQELGARGVVVMIEASHSCMTMRGIRKSGGICVTSAMRGVFRDNLSSRAEILGLIMNPKHS